MNLTEHLPENFINYIGMDIVITVSLSLPPLHTGRTHSILKTE